MRIGRGSGDSGGQSCGNACLWLAPFAMAPYSKAVNHCDQHKHDYLRLRLLASILRAACVFARCESLRSRVKCRHVIFDAHSWIKCVWCRHSNTLYHPRAPIDCRFHPVQRYSPDVHVPIGTCANFTRGTTAGFHGGGRRIFGEASYPAALQSLGLQEQPTEAR